MAPHVLSSDPAGAAPELERAKPNLGGATPQDLRIPIKSSESSDDLAGLSKRDIIIFSGMSHPTSSRSSPCWQRERVALTDKDFDGTIFMQDTGHILFDAHGCGADRREDLDEQIRMGVRSFRDVSEEMWGSLNVPFENGFEVMKEALKIDPHFLEFHDFCIKNNIPFNVISAGLKPILRRVLDEFLGKKQVRWLVLVLHLPVDFFG